MCASFANRRRCEAVLCRLSKGNAMKFPRRKFLHLAAGAAALPAVSRGAWAQAYPSRPVTFVVPYPAGTATDITMRALASTTQRHLGQPIVNENKAGAG